MHSIAEAAPDFPTGPGCPSNTLAIVFSPQIAQTTQTSSIAARLYIDASMASFDKALTSGLLFSGKKKIRNQCKHR